MSQHYVWVAQEDGSHILRERSYKAPKHDWRFVGWLLLGAALAMVLLDIGRWRGAMSAADYLMPVASAVVGILLLRATGQGEVVERSLLRVAPGAEDWTVERCSPTCIDKVERASLQHLAVASVSQPWPGKERVEVEAFALYFVREEGPLSVIEASFDRDQVQAVGEKLAKLLQLELRTGELD